MQQAPAAIDAVGMTELFAPMAAQQAQQRQQQELEYEQPAAGGGSQAGGSQAGGRGRLISALGFGGGSGTVPARQVTGPTAASAAAVDSLLGELGVGAPQQQQQQQGGAPAATQQQAAAGGGSSSKLFEAKPWERAALAASARPCPPRPPTAASAGPASNLVGPAHLVAKHAQRQRQRSVSIEPEQAQERGAATEPAAPLEGLDAAAHRSQQQQPAHSQPEQQQQPAQPQTAGEQAACEAGKAGKAGKAAAAINGFLTQLQSTLSKVGGLRGAGDWLPHACAHLDSV